MSYKLRIERQIISMIKVLFVYHGRIDVSVDKLCNSTISHDTV